MITNCQVFFVFFVKKENQAKMNSTKRFYFSKKLFFDDQFSSFCKENNEKELFLSLDNH